MSIFSGFYYKSKAMSEIERLEKSLAEAHVDENQDSIISFEGRGMKLESENDAIQVTSELERAKFVEGIIFKGNTIGAAAAKKIGEALSKRKEFKRALWSDMFTGRSKEEIPPALIDLFGGISFAGAKLVELDLSDNAFGPNGARGLEGFLRSSSAYSLEILKLNNNGLGVTGGKMISAALKDCYESSKAAGTPLKLRVFVGGRNRLENPGATALADVFKLVGTLEEVTMPQNGIYAPGIAALSDAFAHNPEMRTINLSDNTFTEIGASAFANVLPKMEKLRSLNLDDCLLKPGGGALLADALKESCSHLQELRLCGNELDAASGQKLVASLSEKNDVRILELNANSFGDHGIKNIKELARNLKLEKVLGSFDEDEGEASEEDGEAGGEGSEDEEPESTREQRGSVESKEINVTNGAGDGPRTVPPLIQITELRPDVATLISLTEMAPGKMVDLVLTHLKNPENIVEFVFGIASLIGNSSKGEFNDISNRCCETLLKAAFDDRNGSQLTNVMLEHLGVIKSETNLSKPTNIDGVISMLSNVVKKEWFPKENRSMLAFVLEKRKQKLQADESTLAELMRSLSLA